MQAIFIALLSPLLWALMNVTDKYVIVGKHRSTDAYIIWVGIVNIIFGLILAATISWTGVNVTNFILPIVAGILFSIEAHLYIRVMKTTDTSHLVGLVYFYPIIVAALSFLFLGERLKLAGYAGILLIIIGIVLLMIRLRQLHLRTSAWMMVALSLVIAIDEFTVKVATSGISPWQGTVVTLITMGIILLSGLWRSGTRERIWAERHVVPWLCLSEFFTITAFLTLYLAMDALPATVVSAIGAIQPLHVLWLERLLDRHDARMAKDKLVLPKLFAVILIVVGVVILSMVSG